MKVPLGAVYTTTGVPPPCGFKEILNILTPMVAQSFSGASLTIMLTVPFELPEPPEDVLEWLPLPQPTSANAAAAIKPTIEREKNFAFMSFSLRRHEEI